MIRLALGFFMLLVCAIPAQAQMKSGFLVVVGSLEIKFADYSISQPNGASVLSTDDHGTMELQLFLKKN